MIKTTVGQFLVNDALPNSLRDYNRVYDQKGLDHVLEVLAHEHPEQYREVTKKLSDIGGEVAYRQGGLTFSTDHLSRPAQAESLAKVINQQAQQIFANPKLNREQKRNAVIQLLESNQEKMADASYGQALKDRNPLAIQASMGFRGNKASITGMLGGDLLYTDYKGDKIPFPITRSFSQGLSPVQFLASTFGGRQGVVSTKLCLCQDELVLMSDWSSRPIQQIKIGDFVMGSDLHGRLSPTKVTNVFDNGERQSYRYRFRMGRSRTRYLEVQCTEDHKVLATVKKATGCRFEKEVLSPTPLPLKEAQLRDNPVRNSYSAWLGRGGSSGGRSVPEALLAGLMLGDGCMAPSAHGSYQFSCADKSLILDIEDYLKSLNIELKKAVGENYAYSLNSTHKAVFKRNSHGQVQPGHTNNTKRWLRENLGDKKANDKAMPVDIDTWDNQSVAQLLAGLLSTDGCVALSHQGKHVSVALYLTSFALVEKARWLLEMRFGIWCSSIRTLLPDRTATAVNNLYGFSLVGYEAVTKLIDLIPLVGKKKRRLMEAIGVLSPASHHEHVTCKVQGRENIGLVRTFDIEVDNEHHLFALANGIIVSNSTAEAGALNKQMTQAAHQVMVDRDDDEGDWYKGAQLRGLPVKVEDQGNVGSLLAHDVGGYRKNTVLTPKILRDLQAKGEDKILVRSPMVGGTSDGGIHARDAGVRNRRGLHPAGSFLGIETGQGIGEPLTQLQLSNKHSGGVAGTSKIGGFKLIEALANPPKNMPFGATHAQLDGPVQKIDENPAGGKDVWIGGKKHYVHGQMGLRVKPGDSVEAGDVLSDGVPNPRDVVMHKGLGEGRRYLLQTLHDAYRENRIGGKSLRRNLEPVVRGLADHVVMTDFWNNHAPDDIVKYSHIESNWEPRPGHMDKSPRQAVGKYLEAPVLHHTVGTQIKPSMLPEFEKFKVDSVLVHNDPPPFQPHLLRATENLQHDPDWQVRLGGQYLQRGLLDAAHRGLTSSTTGTSFMPALIQGQDITGSMNKQPKPFG